MEVRLDLSEPVLAVQQGGVTAPPKAILVRPWYALGQLLQIAITSSAEVTAGESASLRVVMPTELSNARISWRQKESFQFSPRFVGYRTLLTNVGTDTPCVISNLTAGWHEFHVAVEAEDGTMVPSLPLALNVRPANDAFVHAQPLPGHSSWTAGTLSAATLETGEPVVGISAITSSVWFRWQAPADGDADFQLVAQTQRMAMFEGNGLLSLREVAGQQLDDSNGPRIRFRAMEGTLYWIYIGGVGDPSAPLPFNFQLAHSLETTRWAEPLSVSFAEREPVPLELESTEPAVAVEFCEFLDNGSTLSRLTRPPWRLTWYEAPPGTHQIEAKLQLKSGEVISVNQRTIQIRPDNVDPGRAYPVLGKSGVIPLGPDPREFGWTNRSWFSWTAPANGVLVLRPAIGIELFESSADHPLTKVNNIAPSRADWLAYPVEPGSDYRLGVEFGGGVSFELLAPLANDNFESATEVSGAQLDLRLMAWRATAQAGEPAHNGSPARHTQWWRWTAPDDGYLRFGPVYQGDKMTELTRLILGPHGVRVTNGITYRLVLDDAGHLTQFPVFETAYTAVFTPLLANDHFANRTGIGGRRVLLSADLKLATAEPTEPIFDPQTTANAGHTAWWSWTAPMTGPVYMRRLPGSSELRMAVFRGNVLGPSMQRVASDRTRFRFPAHEGETFHIAVDAWSPGLGPVEVELVSEAPPLNDAFTARQPVDSHGGLVSGWNFGAQRELHEPNHQGQFGGRSVWYRWKPSETGTATIALRGDLGPPLLAVYRGASVDQLQPVTDLHSSNENAVSFTALAGQEYAIAVDGFLGATGDFELEASLVAGVAIPRLQAVWAASSPVLKVVGHPVVPLHLEVSTNYSQWQPIADVPPGTPASEITLPTDEGSRYFRLAPSSRQ